MLREIAKTLGWPEWGGEGTRFYDLTINDLWLEGKFYNHIPYAFSTEHTKRRESLRMWDRRPMVQLNIPMMTADCVSRKLFGRRHAPKIMHKNKKIMQAMRWLDRKAKLRQRFLDVAYRGQAGSVAVTLKIIDGLPVIKEYQGKYCWPKFKENNDLETLVIAYLVRGFEFQEILAAYGVGAYDSDGQGLDPKADYWYVRAYTEMGVITHMPIKMKLWNPVDGDRQHLKILKEMTEFEDRIDFVTAVWITNITSRGAAMDGRSTFGGALDSLVTLDFGLSQLQRGINACANPMLMTKGRVLNYDPTSGALVLGPSNVLQFAADKKNADGTGVSAADAKYVEMSGNGIDSGLVVCEKLKQWAQETIAVSRKNPETVKGAMSGKAMELIDEELTDLVDVQQSNYGDDGYLVAAIKLGKMSIAAGVPAFKGINPADLDDCELMWPKLYTPSPQDIVYLVQGLAQAVVDGLMPLPAAIFFLDSQIGLLTDMLDAETEELTEIDTSPPEAKPTPSADGESAPGVAQPTKPKKKTGAKADKKQGE